jgi:4-hydroxy-tetrahydrodipicolinate reductase
MSAPPLLRLAVIGHGKMGRAVEALAAERGFEVVAVVRSGTAIARDTLGGADVAVEFTEPGAAAANLRACVAAGCPVVTGTTGWYDQLEQVSEEVWQRTGALLWAANFSVGVHLFARMVREAARLVRTVPAFDAHLVETHHAAKKDAPSGTAGMLERAARSALGRPVPITSVRTGHVPGTHELVLDAPFEQITLTHVARDRRVFADGALLAARWLVGRTGVFTMDDVLGTGGTQ